MHCSLHAKVAKVRPDHVSSGLVYDPGLWEKSTSSSLVSDIVTLMIAQVPASLVASAVFCLCSPIPSARLPTITIICPLSNMALLKPTLKLAQRLVRYGGIIH